MRRTCHSKGLRHIDLHLQSRCHLGSLLGIPSGDYIYLVRIRSLDSVHRSFQGRILSRIQSKFRP